MKTKKILASTLIATMLISSLLTGCSKNDTVRKKEIISEDTQNIQKSVDELYDTYYECMDDSNEAEDVEKALTIWYAMFPENIKELRESYFDAYTEKHPSVTVNIHGVELEEYIWDAIDEIEKLVNYGYETTNKVQVTDIDSLNRDAQQYFNECLLGLTGVTVNYSDIELIRLEGSDNNTCRAIAYKVKDKWYINPYIFRYIVQLSTEEAYNDARQIINAINAASNLETMYDMQEYMDGERINFLNENFENFPEVFKKDFYNSLGIENINELPAPPCMEEGSCYAFSYIQSEGETHILIYIVAPDKNTKYAIAEYYRSDTGETEQDYWTSWKDAKDYMSYLYDNGIFTFQD